jgi:hypothetical protein
MQNGEFSTSLWPVNIKFGTGVLNVRYDSDKLYYIAKFVKYETNESELITDATEMPGYTGECNKETWTQFAKFVIDKINNPCENTITMMTKMFGEVITLAEPYTYTTPGILPSDTSESGSGSGPESDTRTYTEADEIRAMKQMLKPYIDALKESPYKDIQTMAMVYRGIDAMRDQKTDNWKNYVLASKKY